MESNPVKWRGICFAGIEQAFEEHLDMAYLEWRAGPFKYLELGVAGAETLIAAYRHIPGPDKTCTGVDIETHSFGTIIGSAPEAEISFSNYPAIHNLGVCFCTSSKFLEDMDEFGHRGWNFCLIDACHGLPCAKADFLGVEKIIAAGGIVAVHDSMPEDQGLSFQPHCQMGISVRAALEELGLLSDQRAGWKLLSEVHGDKTSPVPGHGMSFFQRL